MKNFLENKIGKLLLFFVFVTTIIQSTFAGPSKGKLNEPTEENNHRDGVGPSCGC